MIRVTLTCDLCGRVADLPRSDNYGGRDPETGDGARAEARGIGWTARHDQDVCPVCREQLPTADDMRGILA